LPGIRSLGARSPQNQRVLTCEDETAKRKAKTEPRAHRRRAIDEATRDPKNETHEEDVEHRLLDQPVKENDRGVERESQTGEQTNAPAEQSSRGQAEDRARSCANDRLDHADDGEIAPERRVDGAKEIWIQRRLVEDIGPHQLPPATACAHVS